MLNLVRIKTRTQIPGQDAPVTTALLSSRYQFGRSLTRALTVRNVIRLGTLRLRHGEGNGTLSTATVVSLSCSELYEAIKHGHRRTGVDIEALCEYTDHALEDDETRCLLYAHCYLKTKPASRLP